MAEIELRRIEKSYGETAVVKGVSLSIRDGESLSLVDGYSTVVVRTHPDASCSEAGRLVGLQIDPACLLQFDSAGMRQGQAEQVEAAV